MVDLIKEQTCPLPPGNNLLPVVIVYGTESKVGFDVYSCYMKTIQAKNSCLPPLTV